MFLVQNANYFEQEKKWGWPLFWLGTIEKTLDRLSSKGVKCFEISSSYGLSGWILASEVEYRSAGL